MHCGWLDESEWPASRAGIPRVGDPIYEGNVCPAWLVRQAAVHDGAEAAAALESGCLSTYDPGNKAVVWEAAQTLKRATDRHAMLSMERVH
jgi:hypothetical protein